MRTSLSRLKQRWDMRNIFLTCLAIALTCGPILTQDTGRILPEDLTYRGAFRLPETTGASVVETWEWGGHAMACFPNGDSYGPEDGFPGSIFATGRAWTVKTVGGGAMNSAAGYCFTIPKTWQRWPQASDSPGNLSPMPCWRSTSFSSISHPTSRNIMWVRPVSMHIKDFCMSSSRMLMERNPSSTSGRSPQNQGRKSPIPKRRNPPPAGNGPRQHTGLSRTHGKEDLSQIPSSIEGLLHKKRARSGSGPP